MLRLQAALAEAKHPDYSRVKFRKVTRASVASAEKKLKVPLPPSYVELVTQLGAFEVVGRNSASYNQLLTPAQMVQHTLMLRAAYADDDPKTGDVLKDSLLFQGNLYLDNFFIFLISSKRKNGEMGVHEFYHDDQYVPPDGFCDLHAHMRDLVDNWVDTLAG